jgi:hypothetical protein
MDTIKGVTGGIQLHSGRIFSPLWPTPESFTLYDVIHGISGQPRFAFHTKVPYFVAQHCIIGTRWFLKRGMLNEARWFYFHEGEEGLGLGDMPTPIKYLPEMDAYRSIGKGVQVAVFKKAGLLGTPPPIVKELDRRLGAAEAKILCKVVPQWALEFDTSDIIVKPYKNPFYGKRAMLELFPKLFPKLNVMA